MIVGKEPVKLLLKRKQIEKGNIKNKDVYIIISYHQLIQNDKLLPFLISLAAAICKAALTSGAAALGAYAGKKIVEKITDSSTVKGEGLTLPGILLKGQGLKIRYTQNCCIWIGSGC